MFSFFRSKVNVSRCIWDLAFREAQVLHRSFSML
jgi:hypothetical protein